MNDVLFAHGPARILADALRQLHRKAGKPSLGDISLKVCLNESDMQDALNGANVPDWAIVDALVRTLRGNIKGFRGLFGVVQESTRLTSSGDQPPGSADASCEIGIHPAWIQAGIDVEITAPGWVACDSCTSPRYDNQDAWKPGSVTCTTCSDTGTTHGARAHLVRIAKETLTADRYLRVPGMGESSEPGLIPGDLHVRVKPDRAATLPTITPTEPGNKTDFWSVNGPPGQDLAHHEPISWLRATRGGTLSASFEEKTPCTTCSGTGLHDDALCKTCDGDGLTMGHRHVNVSIPKRVYAVHWLSLPGQGRPGPRGGQPGDLHIILNSSLAPRTEKIRTNAENAREKAKETWRDAAPKVKSTTSWLWKNRGEVATAVSIIAGLAAQAARSKANQKKPPPPATSSRPTAEGPTRVWRYNPPPPP